ncbi:hypothetical protein M0R45_036153 [Rubus argutus]|uniref:Uncharacterized protein n=1 Tax=Rubus argutus TaxID=59490 RepID=A0AAW1VVA9_RUBAR
MPLLRPLYALSPITTAPPIQPNIPMASLQLLHGTHSTTKDTHVLPQTCALPQTTEPVRLPHRRRRRKAHLSCATLPCSATSPCYLLCRRCAVKPRSLSSLPQPPYAHYRRRSQLYPLAQSPQLTTTPQSHRRLLLCSSLF